MPRADVTALIANNLHSLPHEDGRPRRLMHFSQFGKDDDTRKRVQILAHDIGDSLQTLLERGGYSLSHKDDPKPADAEGYKTARVKCARCGQQLYTLGVDANMTATLSALAIKSLTQLRHDCR